MTIQKFDLSRSPVALYPFEGDVRDYSGNQLDLTVAGPFFRRLYGNALGLSGGVALSRNGTSDALLRLQGDKTIQALCVLRSAPASNFLVAYGGSGETEPPNYEWSVQLLDQNQVVWFSEHGAGVDDKFVDAPANLGLPAFGVPFLLSARLRGNVAQIFVDGVPFGPPSPVLNAPTGGTASQLLVNPGASTAFDLFCLEVVGRALSDAEILDTYNQTLGSEFGELVPEVQSLWVGALSDASASVVARSTHASDSLRLGLTGPGGTTHSASAPVDHGAAARFDFTGLSPDTAYNYWLEADGVPLAGQSGSFRTAPSGACSFTVAFAGDAQTDSNHPSFAAIRALSPLLFLHLGDAHYLNISVNDPAQFRAAYDRFLSQPRQSDLFANVPTAYVFDDHDYGANNSNGSSPSKPAACMVYRERVPSHPLVEAGPSGSIYHYFDVGRVRFVVTDERSAAVPDSNTDNSSKTMLGATQKAWFEGVLSNSPGKLIVWVCSRWFGPAPVAGADNWGGFSTERTEIADFIKAHCHGRVVVISADMHALAIDDGSHHDFATGGGEPLPVFQAAPLDIAAPAGAGTYTHGPFVSNGLFGTMDVSDSGGSSIGVTWTGRDSTGAVLATHSFSVSV